MNELGDALALLLEVDHYEMRKLFGRLEHVAFWPALGQDTMLIIEEEKWVLSIQIVPQHSLSLTIRRADEITTGTETP
jgi:hypothetical protein